MLIMLSDVYKRQVVIVQVADGLVQEDKVKRLAKAADKSDALLLPEGKLAGSFVGFVGNAGCFGYMGYEGG